MADVILSLLLRVSYVPFSLKLAHSFSVTVNWFVYITSVYIYSTMKSAASVIAFAASALAATIEIQVSGVFTPDSVTASPGDVLQFNFESQHSVVRSEYDSPCVGATDNAIYSGAMSSVCPHGDTTCRSTC